MHHFPTLFRILSTLHPLIAIKKSSALSLLRHKLSKALPFLYKASSSLLISSIYISVNSSRSVSFSRIAKILSVFIFFATKLDVYSETTKSFSIFQDNPGIDNSWCNPLIPCASCAPNNSEGARIAASPSTQCS